MQLTIHAIITSKRCVATRKIVAATTRLVCGICVAGQFDRAEKYFRTAIETLTQRNPNPIDGEPLFNLGLTLCYLGKDDEAFDAFYKSVWNAAWMDSGLFSACPDCC